MTRYYRGSAIRTFRTPQGDLITLSADFEQSNYFDHGPVAELNEETLHLYADAFETTREKLAERYGAQWAAESFRTLIDNAELQQLTLGDEP